MAKLNMKQMRDLARSLVAKTPGGIRYGVLLERIHTDNPENSKKAIASSVFDLATRFPGEITKPSRGLFVSATGATGTVLPPDVPPPTAGEEVFYAPFAEWLKTDLDEATVAVPLGEAFLRRRWGTPDVVGVYKPVASDRIKFPLEIVSAEIKVDPYQSVVAFGQAVAYRLFSTKSYIVMPASIPPDDYSRLAALCLLFGIGLVAFETDVNDPAFDIRVRAQRHPPDMFYVNEFAERIHQHDAGKYNELFG